MNFGNKKFCIIILILLIFIFNTAYSEDYDVSTLNTLLLIENELFQIYETLDKVSGDFILSVAKERNDMYFFSVLFAFKDTKTICRFESTRIKLFVETKELKKATLANYLESDAKNYSLKQIEHHNIILYRLYEESHNFSKNTMKFLKAGHNLIESAIMKINKLVTIYRKIEK